MENEQFKKARDSAVRMLGYRAHSKRELRDKLRQKQHGGDVVDEVIESLTEYGYLDDYKFAVQFAEEKMKRKSLGSARVAYELRQRGVDSGIIERVLEGTDVCEEEKAAALLEKKLRGEPVDETNRNKAVGLLKRHGYRDIQKIIKEYNNGI